MKTLISRIACCNLLAGAALATVCLLTGASALATQYTVQTLADNGTPNTLRSLIGSASSDATIIFNPTLTANGPGTITLTSGDLVVSQAVTIIGPGAASLTINGNGISRVFDIAAGASQPVLIADLTISNGYNSANNGGNGLGGGILNSASLTLSNCIVKDNFVYGASGVNPIGGGICNFGSLGLTNCTIEGNEAVGIGGASVGESDGGGIWSSGPLMLTNCRVEGNGAAGTFAGVNVAKAGNAFGGGIFADLTSSLSLVNCLVTQNSAVGGAGVNNDGADGLGGGIYCENGGFVALTNCTLSSNTALGGSVLGPGQAGSASGGGIYFDGKGGELLNCTIATNTSTGGAATTGGQGGAGYGGGVYLDAACEFYSCTICSNQCLNNNANSGSPVQGGTGGGIYAVAPPTLGNCIVSGNSVAGTGSGPDVGGAVASMGFNFIGDADGSSQWISTDTTGSGSTKILNPLLGPLRYNGGLTPTMLPAGNSPVIDEGKSFQYTAGRHTDQRGDIRPVATYRVVPPPGGDYTDIGSVEFQVFPPIPKISVPQFPTGQQPPPSPQIVINWCNDLVGTGPATNIPIFAVQRAIGGFPLTSNNSWTTLTNIPTLESNEWVVTDFIMPGPVAVFYRLVGPYDFGLATPSH